MMQINNDIYIGTISSNGESTVCFGPYFSISEATERVIQE